MSIPSACSSPSIASTTLTFLPETLQLRRKPQGSLLNLLKDIRRKRWNRSVPNTPLTKHSTSRISSFFHSQANLGDSIPLEPLKPVPSYSENIDDSAKPFIDKNSLRLQLNKAKSETEPKIRNSKKLMLPLNQETTRTKVKDTKRRKVCRKKKRIEYESDSSMSAASDETLQNASSEDLNAGSSCSDINAASTSRYFGKSVSDIEMEFDYYDYELSNVQATPGSYFSVPTYDLADFLDIDADEPPTPTQETISLEDLTIHEETDSSTVNTEITNIDTITFVDEDDDEDT